MIKQKALLLAGLVLALTQAVQAQDVDLPISQDQQQAFTADEVLDSLLDGNERFAAGRATQRDISARMAASALGQHPKAVILSCLDSRVPVEKVFDVSIGDVFVGRVAGNVVNADQLGSMEFATRITGAKLVMILGHNQCGAVKGAIDGAELGNLTALLAKIRPAVDAVEGFSPVERSSSNKQFLDEVTAQNVWGMLVLVREQSPVLVALEKAGQIRIVGAMYDLHTGKVTLIE